MHKLIILMGPPGSGKTTLGEALSLETGYKFYDMDRSMPENLKEKMRGGSIISSSERAVYFDKVISELHDLLLADDVIAACVIPHNKDRRVFTNLSSNSKLIKLEVPADVLFERLEKRKEHFFNPDALQKMLETDELPTMPFISLDCTEPIGKLISLLRIEIEKW